MNCRVKVVVS
uniref:Uncharacterized protein n=1 Tax=Anguilla anguilla TaxID=7936 RepID=A0A0E9Q9H9_ANGAN